MSDTSFLGWPFFTDRHRALAGAVERWSATNLPAVHGDVDAACRELVQKLGRDGFLGYTAPNPDAPAQLDVRTLCLMRERLRAMTGLPISRLPCRGLASARSVCSALRSSGIGSSVRAPAERLPLSL